MSDESNPMSSVPWIPDYPEAPLPAWQHYGITRYSEQKIRDELVQNHSTGYLIGISLSYQFPTNAQTYEIAFGKTESIGNIEGNVPLSDEFLLDLCETVDLFVTQNTPGYSGNLDVLLKIVISAPLSSLTTTCRIVQAGECDKGHAGSKKKCKSSDGVHWKCMHGKDCA